MSNGFIRQLRQAQNGPINQNLYGLIFCFIRKRFEKTHLNQSLGL